MRASDQDRQEAVLALTDHFTEGRLDRDEFETRMGTAQEATYLHDLDPLFEDLPVRRSAPPVPVGARPAGRRRRALPPVPVVPLVIAAFIAVMVLTGGHAFWLVFPLWFLGASMMRRRMWQHHMVAARPQPGPSAYDDRPRWR